MTLSVADFAARLGMAPRSVRLLVARGDLAAEGGRVPAEALADRERLWKALAGHAVAAYDRTAALVREFAALHAAAPPAGV